MRHINKGEPIPEFVRFKEKYKPHDWKDINKVPDLSRKCREAILLNEQNGLSGYTEMPLNVDGNIHIDHYKQKGLPEFKHLEFEWANYIIDSIDSNFGACYKDGKHGIQSASDYNTLFNPVEEYPEQYFSYWDDGRIMPKAGISQEMKDKVQKTIDIFNLNHDTLKGRRRNIFIFIENMVSSGKNNHFDEQQIRELMANYGFPSVVEFKLQEIKNWN